ncbi:malate dehydrogenase [Williamwhitmania taraxaci]|uniref:Malate dehydrogenase n=1 Tax=Williamwhitmania taraxaci TaxID=1640674 RepID=A0A1G6RPH2_9BACT|nr:malate dehydrogenase [Williamwhitmania taraxaci]SDD06552.1 malate dehydrogenase (NAD) [Williamwhitmania taraxaci]
MKITIIGAGNVGATCANVLAHKELANQIVLLDIVEGVAEGKSLDMWQTASVNVFDTRIVGVTNDYLATKGSSVIVITSGIPRKPGMSRGDLISTNARIVKEVTEKVVKYSPTAIIVVVSNPLDVMTYVAFLAAHKKPCEVFGMAGILDSARYKTFIAEALDVSPRDVSALLLGGHGNSMVPLVRYTSVGGIPVTQLLDKAVLDKIVDRTRNGGGELVKLMGTSAWYAPGAAAAAMVEAIVRDQRRIMPVCAHLNGQYGLADLYMGVPVKLGKRGIIDIIEIDLNDEERGMLNESAKDVRELMDELNTLNLF